MLQSLGNDTLADQLLRIACEPDLRQGLYDRLGEYCHQCRNRLNSLKLSLYLIMRHSSGIANRPWESIDRLYQDLERRIDQIQTLCRPLRLSPVTLGLDLLIDDRREGWESLLGRSGKTLVIARPTDRAVVGFDVEWLGQGLDAFVAWRASVSGGSVATVRWWAELGLVHLVWEESGVPIQLAGALSSEIDALWAFPLLARIILAHHGEFRLQLDSGYRLEMTWPTVPSSP